MNRHMNCYSVGLLLLISACSSEAEPEKVVPTASADSEEAVKNEAKSIEAAADEAAAVIEEEANAEIKAADEAEAPDSLEGVDVSGDDAL